jgi:hypothetical protein
MSNKSIINGVDYGPLAALMGEWQGDKGTDTAPEPDGSEENNYSETLTFEAIGNTSNAEMQDLAGVLYHQVVTRIRDQKPIHNQTGYWMWDKENNLVMHSFTIPRGVCVLAGGEVSTDNTLEVQAAMGDKEWEIIQSPFMKKKARTVKYQHKVTVKGDTLNYQQTMSLEIYGKQFEHTDNNTLKRVK